LNRFVDDAATRAVDWNRPNKRFLDSGFFLPGSRADSVGCVAVCVDTSGSIDDVTLAAFAAEIQAMLDDGRVERVHVVYCDARVRGSQEFTAGETVDLEADGGGGTSFAPAFAHVESECTDAAAIVYLTDLEGYGDCFGPEPLAPVLWAVQGSQRRAPWGEVVPLDPYA
jgi:predicted metal-dependent peptidase